MTRSIDEFLVQAEHDALDHTGVSGVERSQAQYNGGAIQGPQPTLNFIASGSAGISVVENGAVIDITISASTLSLYGSIPPRADRTGAVGSSGQASRGDHKHPIGLQTTAAAASGIPATGSFSPLAFSFNVAVIGVLFVWYIVAGSANHIGVGVHDETEGTSLAGSGDYYMTWITGGALSNQGSGALYNDGTAALRTNNCTYNGQYSVSHFSGALTSGSQVSIGFGF